MFKIFTVISLLLITSCANSSFHEMQLCSKACKRSNMQTYEDDTIVCSCHIKVK